MFLEFVLASVKTTLDPRMAMPVLYILIKQALYCHVLYYFVFLCYHEL